MDDEAAGTAASSAAPSPAPGAASVSSADLKDALARAKAKLRWVDRVFSTYKPQSPVSRLRSAEIKLEQAPPEVAEVLELCRRARDASDGWFDPWGLPGGVDPTGLVKGWGAERALDEIKAAGVPGAMINAGGDVAVYGQPEPGQPWRVAVRDPRYAERLLLIIEFDGPGAVATSGRYERGDHLLVPGSGEAAQGLLSATVIGGDLTFTDALATALFVSGGKLLERLGRLPGYHGIVVDLDGTLRASAGFPFHLPYGMDEDGRFTTRRAAIREAGSRDAA